MQRIIQINIAGRVLPIEEDAYLLLKDYLNALHRQFDTEDSREEIVEDIEYRIAELFSIRLQSGAHAIDGADVTKVIENLGTPSALGGKPSSSVPVPYIPGEKAGSSPHSNSRGFDNTSNSAQRRIFRNPNDKLLGGVCSGLSNYFDVDPVIIRLIWAASVIMAGFGFVSYIIAWIVIPVAKTPQDFANMTGGNPMNFHDVTRNVANEMQDLKKRGEEMSRELKDFFSKKK
jgi:phage shock protein C